MKAYVYVSLKKSVLDPQGKTIQGALKKMGYQGLQEVRQGKYFEITLNGGLTRTDAQAEVTVKLAENGRSVTARGADPDTLVASARAYIAALNKLAALHRGKQASKAG